MRAFEPAPAIPGAGLRPNRVMIMASVIGPGRCAHSPPIAPDVTVDGGIEIAFLEQLWRAALAPRRQGRDSAHGGRRGALMVEGAEFLASDPGE